MPWHNVFTGSVSFAAILRMAPIVGKSVLMEREETVKRGACIILILIKLGQTLLQFVY